MGIYLDNNATTAIDPEVIEAMLAVFKEWGNPSSIHRYGQRAKGILYEATHACAQFFGVAPDEIFFNSGATEGLNFLIRSLPANSHIVTSTLEHAAVLEPLKNLGGQVTYLEPILGKGAISCEQVRRALRENTSAIILTAANNETGIITSELNEIAFFAEQAEIPLILDGVAYLGKGMGALPRGVVGACFSGHKIHGPPGIGLTLIRKGFKAKPFIFGGSQQRGFRAGTENLPAIVGLAKALSQVAKRETHWVAQMSEQRDLFERGLLEHLPEIHIHGKGEKRLCNTSNIAFLGLDGETLLMRLDLAGLAASHGSACSSGALESSRILLSMGIPPKIARSSLRFSLSRNTTHEEISQSIALITQTVTLLKIL